MFTLNKLIALVAIVMLVWYGLKFLGRVERARRPPAAEQGRSSRRIAAEELTRCRTCGVYLLPNTRKGCGRPDCPYG